MTEEEINRIRSDALQSLVSPKNTIRLVDRILELESKVSALRSAIPEGVKTIGTPLQLPRSRALCQHCGWEAPASEHASARQQINAHAAVCEKHPQRAVEAERDAALTRVRELESALLPFAAYVDHRGSAMPDDTPMDSVVPVGPSLGDCRHAAAVLAKDVS